MTDSTNGYLEWICAKCKTQNVMDASMCKDCGSIGSLSDKIVKVFVE